MNSSVLGKTCDHWKDLNCTIAATNTDVTLAPSGAPTQSPEVVPDGVPCVDNASYRESVTGTEYSCEDWVGYQCTNFREYEACGYTATDMLDLSSNCPVSCGTCPDNGEPPDNAESNACLCAETWDSPDDGAGCTTTITNCPRVACDGGGGQPWCLVSNAGCDEDEGGGWSYCTPPDDVTEDDNSRRTGRALLVDDVDIHDVHRQCADSCGLCANDEEAAFMRALLYGAEVMASIRTNCPVSCGRCETSCEDDRNYRDMEGSTCSAWIGYDCTVDWDGMDSAMIDDLQASCPFSCQLCGCDGPDGLDGAECEHDRERVMDQDEYYAENEDDWHPDEMLLPFHKWNSASVGTSVLSGLIWVYKSPHRNLATARNLDKYLMSFFIVQLFGNMMVTGAALYTCPNSNLTYLALESFFNVPFIGISVVGSNFLCHRYLLEKASIMTNQIANEGDSSEWQLTKSRLDRCLKMEIRALGLLLVAFSLFFDHTVWFTEKNRSWEDRALEYEGVKLAAHITLSTLVVIVMILDFGVSVVLTSIFLRPLLRILESGRSAGTSEAFQKILKTKHFTLAGAVLAVTSSSLLYVNLVVWYLWGYIYAAENWHMNPMLFGGNLDSILNDISMLFVCGVVKNLSECLPSVSELKRQYKSRRGRADAREDGTRVSEMFRISFAGHIPVATR